MKIFQLTAALDQLERSIVGAGPMRMLDISPWPGDPLVLFSPLMASVSQAQSPADSQPDGRQPRTTR